MLLVCFLTGCRFASDGFAPAQDGATGLSDGSLLPDGGKTPDGGTLPDGSKTPDGSTVPDAASPPDAAPSPDAAVVPVGVRCGKTAVSDRATVVDLTAEGSSDWVHWGFMRATDVHRKITGGGQISFAITGPPGQVAQYADNIIGFTWSDGMPTPTAMASHTGIYIPGNARGFTFQLSTDGLPRDLKLYLGGFRSTGTLVATLSDGSGTCTTTAGDAIGSYNAVFDLSFRSTATATLAISWLETQDFVGGNVSLEAATLH